MREPQPVGRKHCVRMLLYALPGAGKTRLISSGQRTLIIRPPTDHTDSVDFKTDAEELEIEDHSQLLEVYQALQQGKLKGYDWVWLDGITLFEEWGLDDVFQAAIDRKPDRQEFGPDKGEYGVNRGRITKHIRDMVGLSKQGMFNYGVTANVMEIRDPVRDKDIWVPAFGSPKTTSSLKLCGYMNVVAYLNMGDEKGNTPAQRTLLVDAQNFVGKDQYNCFPKLKSGRHGFINPTMADLEAALGGRTRRPTRKRPARAKAKATNKRKRATRRRS